MEMLNKFKFLYIWSFLTQVTVYGGAKMAKPVKRIANYTCESDGDCVVENVGNGTAIYLECVNKNSAPEQDNAVMAWFSSAGLMNIDYCVCEDGRCSGRKVLRDGPYPGRQGKPPTAVNAVSRSIATHATSTPAFVPRFVVFTPSIQKPRQQQRQQQPKVGDSSPCI